MCTRQKRPRSEPIRSSYNFPMAAHFRGGGRGEFLVREDDSNGELRREHFEIVDGQLCEFRMLDYGENELIELKLGPSETGDTNDEVNSPDARVVTGSRGTTIWVELGREHRWSGGQ